MFILEEHSGASCSGMLDIKCPSITLYDPPKELTKVQPFEMD